MTYATQADIEARYPGELAQAGPREPDGDLDAAAIALALAEADATLDRALRAIGWDVPLASPAPDWVKGLAVDLALYLATPTVLASQADFSDRKTRYQAALATLEGLVRGTWVPPLPAGVTTTLNAVYTASNVRVFRRDTL